MVTGECDNYHGTIPPDLPQTCNPHTVIGECDATGTNSSQANPHAGDPHLTTENSDRRGETQAVLGRQASRMNTQGAHQGSSITNENHKHKLTGTQCIGRHSDYAQQPERHPIQLTII